MRQPGKGKAGDPQSMADQTVDGHWHDIVAHRSAGGIEDVPPPFVISMSRVDTPATLMACTWPAPAEGREVLDDTPTG